MKTNNIGIAILAVATLIAVGCVVETDKSQYNRTFFPTNHWRVVGQGTNGQVIVETKSTNLLEHFRVHAATAVGYLTNGQPTRVEMVVRWNPTIRTVELISSKAYPAIE